MFSVAHIGETAHAVLQCETSGVVEARFERCAYINFSDNYICVALASIGRGPLNVVYSEGVQRLPEHMQAGVMVSCSPIDNLLEIPCQGNQKIAQFGNAVICNSKATGGTGTGTGSGSGSVQFVSINRRQLHKLTRPSTGLFDAVIVNAGERRSSLDASLRRFAAPSLYELTQWLHAVARLDEPMQAPDKCIGRLLGAGPGLTPSGDDLLAGVLLSLRYNGFDAAAEELAALILRDAAQRTNAISVSMLREAAEGRAGEYALRILAMYGSSDGLDAAVMSHMLNRMGESSGWDFLSGVAMVFDALENPITNGRQVHG